MRRAFRRVVEPSGAAGGGRLYPQVAHSRGAISRARSTQPAEVFGPRYARPLQAVINHAERFSELLAEVGLGGVDDDPARAWLTRRCEEMELVLALLVGDWAQRRIGLPEAARSAGLYLDDLHAGARRYLGLGPALPCCSGAASPTVLAADEHQAITRPVPEVVFRKDANETWVDPETLLEGLDMRGGDWPWPRHRGQQARPPYRPIQKAKS